MDIWSAGCVLFEVVALYPLFPGSDELDQINRIHKILGSPSPKLQTKLTDKGSSKSKFNFPQQKGIGITHLIPHASSDCVDLLTRTLKYDFSERLTAKATITHPYFSDLRGVFESPGVVETANANATRTTLRAPKIEKRYSLRKNDHSRSFESSISNRKQKIDGGNMGSTFDYTKTKSVSDKKYPILLSICSNFNFYLIALCFCRGIFTNLTKQRRLNKQKNFRRMYIQSFPDLHNCEENSGGHATI